MAHHNPYVECPYDIAHQVPKLRMQIHLIKCRKNNPHLAKLMKSCPFNATHIMPERELELHLQCCTDRCLIEGQKYNLSAEDHGDLGNPTFHTSIPKETWDDAECEGQPHMTSAHQDSRPHPPRSDPYLPGGALAPSASVVSSAGSSVPPSVLGLGRGRLLLLALERNRST